MVPPFEPLPTPATVRFLEPRFKAPEAQPSVLFSWRVIDEHEDAQ